jgi:hypothetical protein
VSHEKNDLKVKQNNSNSIINISQTYLGTSVFIFYIILFTMSLSTLLNTAEVAASATSTRQHLPSGPG